MTPLIMKKIIETKIKTVKIKRWKTKDNPGIQRGRQMLSGDVTPITVSEWFKGYPVIYVVSLLSFQIYMRRT